MRNGDIRSWVERDAEELFITEYQRVARLPCPPKPSGDGWARHAGANGRRRVNGPVCHTGPSDQCTQKSFELCPAEVAPPVCVRSRTGRSSSGVLHKETSNPSHAVRNRFLLGAGFPENADIPRWPARLRIQGCGCLPVAARPARSLTGGRQIGPIPVLTHSRTPVLWKSTMIGTMIETKMAIDNDRDDDDDRFCSRHRCPDRCPDLRRSLSSSRSLS